MKCILGSLVLLAGTALFAQAPSADWRTVETPHFRVHYPREYEEWALAAARRLEPIRRAVAEEVGFAPEQTIDVIVTNPIADPNGSAWPLLDTPRIILFAEPPAPDEQLGSYGSWIDLLAVHETTHIVHMLRPSRNPFERLLERAIPFAPITLRAPRWVLEGYATLVEGRLTGAGRPNSTIRALILRRWAESGRLPTYGQLNSDRRFLGMSMAYLAGSAYLEWLDARAKAARPGSTPLRDLWRRLTARRRRSFDEAFAGVFGDRPDRLYGRFTAELTASAMAVDRNTRLDEGELFQETPRASGEPAVSPDGEKIAVVIRAHSVPQKLVVWSTGAETEEEAKYEKRLKEILERDSEDVAPVRAKPLPRKAVETLTMPDGGEIVGPRWTPDGNAILFAHRMPDGEGFLHFDLFRWDFHELRRVTHLADVRDADPYPDGRTAIAVRSRFGASQLVKVDLETGAVTPLAAASNDPSSMQKVESVETHPRVSPDGERIAHVAHREGGWTLYIDDQAIELPGDPATPEWLSNDALVVTLFSGGFAELCRISNDRVSTTITRTAGGAFAPAPSPDGRIFFMSLEPDGYVVRVLDSPKPAPPAPLVESSMVPAIPPSAVAPPPAARFAPSAIAPPHDYGIGRQELFFFPGFDVGPEQRSLEVAIRLGDVMGRLDTLLIGSTASGDGVRGGALVSAWRGWPVTVAAHLFKSDRDDTDNEGIELRGSWSHRFPRSTLALEGGALSDDDDFLFGSAALSTFQQLGRSRIAESARIDVDDKHRRAMAAASVRKGSIHVTARYQIDRGDVVALGGIASSILPRSAYALTVLDPALPVAILSGRRYDGWRVETTLPSLPLTGFYERHEIDRSRLSLAGVKIEMHFDPNPILKLPALDVTLGAAYAMDAPIRGKTNWWLGMRWRP